MGVDEVVRGTGCRLLQREGSVGVWVGGVVGWRGWLGAVGGLVVGFLVQFVCHWVLWYAQGWVVVGYLQYV